MLFFGPLMIVMVISLLYFGALSELPTNDIRVSSKDKIEDVIVYLMGFGYSSN